MSDPIKLSLEISNTSNFNDLAVELWLDDIKFFDQTISPGTHKVGHTFEEDESEHQFKIILKNKKHHHTTIDQDGNILSDSLIDIRNICVDAINIDVMMYENAVYTHSNNNENGQLSTNKFYGHLGCNGEVTLDFHTPFYLWLLENM